MKKGCCGINEKYNLYGANTYNSRRLVPLCKRKAITSAAYFLWNAFILRFVERESEGVSAKTKRKRSPEPFTKITILLKDLCSFKSVFFYWWWKIFNQNLYECISSHILGSKCLLRLGIPISLNLAFLSEQ